MAMKQKTTKITNRWSKDYPTSLRSLSSGDGHRVTHLLAWFHPPKWLCFSPPSTFRPLIADSAVLTAINTGMVTTRDFVRVGGSVALTAAGRKGFFRAYELRMDSLVTHPLFDYRVSYRRLLEIQARLLARVLEGEIGEYPVFTTR